MSHSRTLKQALKGHQSETLVALVERTKDEVARQRVIDNTPHPKVLQYPARGKALKRRWAENRERMLSIVRHKTPRGKIEGMPQAGWTKKQFLAAKEKAKKETQIIMTELAKEGLLPEDTMSQEALGVAVEIMRTPGSARDRLAAARTVLDFTKQKPASKDSENAVSAAEAFLGALLQKEQKS